MKKILLLLIVTVITFSKVNANIRRVGFFGTPLNNVDYTSLQEAHSAAEIGDTIMLYPSQVAWNATFTKRLVVLGYGYDVDTAFEGSAANPGRQAMRGIVSASIALANGITSPDSSIFEGIDGFYLSNNPSGFDFYDTKDIIVRRCKGTIYFRYGIHSNLKIIQSIITGNTGDGTAFVNLLVSNSVVNGFQTSNLGGQSIMFINNIFSALWNDGNVPSVYRNNVFLYETPFSFEAGSDYQNNVFVTSVSGNKGLNNKFNVNRDAIFVGYSTQGNKSNDGRWVLKSTSPAKAAGEGGIDCGIYAAGSQYPYKLSGLPSIPAFYRLDAPSTTVGTGTYNITFSVRSNN